MLVWVAGKDGLVGKAMIECLEVMHIGTGKDDVDIENFPSIEEFFLKHHPTHIINCTAVVEVDKTENELLDKAKAVNIDGVENLARLAKKYDVKLMHISTDYVFDGTSASSYKEEDKTNPVNAYGKTKLAGENILFTICPEAVCVRTASVYGYGKKGLIDSLVELLKQQEVCSFVTDQISSPTHADDLTKAVTYLFQSQGVFHFVNEGFCSRYELLEFVKHLMDKYKIPHACKKLEKKKQIDFKRPAKRPVRSVLSTEKITKLLDYPIRSWQNALEEYFVRKWVDK